MASLVMLVHTRGDGGWGYYPVGMGKVLEGRGTAVPVRKLLDWFDEALKPWLTAKHFSHWDAESRKGCQFILVMGTLHISKKLAAFD